MSQNRFIRTGCQLKFGIRVKFYDPHLVVAWQNGFVTNNNNDDDLMKTLVDFELINKITIATTICSAHFTSSTNNSQNNSTIRTTTSFDPWLLHLLAVEIICFLNFFFSNRILLVVLLNSDYYIFWWSKLFFKFFLLKQNTLGCVVKHKIMKCAVLRRWCARNSYDMCIRTVYRTCELLTFFSIAIL